MMAHMRRAAKIRDTVPGTGEAIKSHAATKPIGNTGRSETDVAVSDGFPIEAGVGARLFDKAAELVLAWHI